MKNIYKLIAALFFLTLTVQAQEVQEVIYTQNFSSSAAYTSDFDKASATWTVTNGTLTTNNPSANTTYTNKLIKNNVNVNGYMLLNITWSGYRTKFSNGNDITRYPAKVTYTTNLVKTPQTLTANEANNSAVNTWNTTSVEIFLPEGTTTVNFTISIDVNTKKRDYYALDNLKLEGTRDQPLNPLPVELISFKGASQNGAAKLSWATAMELNNEKFVVERSQDGKSFAVIGEVSGKGNSSTREDYSFTDANPISGVNYYRLRQVDFDGAQDYSKLVTVTIAQNSFGSSTDIAQVYPTVASTEVKINLALSNANVLVMDANGRQVAEYSNAGRQVVVPVAELQQGVYFVTVTDGTQRQTQRFIKR